MKSQLATELGGDLYFYHPFSYKYTHKHTAAVSIIAVPRKFTQNTQKNFSGCEIYLPRPIVVCNQAIVFIFSNTELAYLTY
jgi:hypothetical protein